jgi:PEP-CTERM motif
MFQKTFVVALAVFALAVLAAMSSVAEADLILMEPDGDPALSVAASFTALGAQGFGNAPRMLTLQTNTVETGSVTPVNVVQGDAVPGANKSTTPTLSALGWSTGENVGIGFNSDQTGGSGITMQSLVLTIYNGTTAVGTFSLAASLTPLTFTQADLALQQGNGNSVFNFGLTDGQQTTFNALVAQFGTGLFAGLASQLGCPAGAPASCLVSNDGPDSFIGFVQPSTAVIPEPGTLLLAGTALVGVMAVARKKLHRTGTPGSA